MNRELKIKNLLIRLEEAKKTYYELGNSILSDEEFDLLENELQVLDPEHPYFEHVGTTITRGEKIVHSIPMLSCEKCKTFTELSKWIKRLSLPEQTDFLIEPKIDGLSASCVYKNGKIVSVSTRGDGQIGKDITIGAQYIKTIPQNLENSVDLEVRGELYLPRDTTFDTGGKPLRNNCVGLVGRKNRYEDLYHVKFIAYQILGYGLKTESSSLNYLEKLGFDVICFKNARSVEEIEQYYTQYLQQFRHNWNYETDGLIIIINNRELHQNLDMRWVVRHHHHYLIAFKPPAQSRKTQLRHIEWQISRKGNLIPMAVFNSIQIGGAMISRASLHNVAIIEKLCLSAGDEILVERSNDVIPSVKENLSQKEKNKEFISTLILQKCPVCHTLLERRSVHLFCPNDLCSERQIQQILYWVTSCKMKNIAEATIRLLYEKQLIGSIIDLYHISANDLEILDGFGDKKIKNFLDEVYKSRKMTVLQFIARLGISQLQEISLEKLKIKTLDDFWNFSDTKHVIGRNMIAWREENNNRNLVQELILILKLEDHFVADRQKICLTGTGPLPRDEIVKKVENKGFHVVNTVSQEVVFVLCDNIESYSKKLEKAKILDIKVISYEDFFLAEGISANS